MSKKLDNNQTTSSCSECFKSLGVSTRFAIYEFLRKHEKAKVSELVDYAKLSQPTVSYHLLDMKKNGLLTSKKLGKEVYYSVNNKCPHTPQECVLTNLHFN